jgi:hypothetical protein
MKQSLEQQDRDMSKTLLAAEFKSAAAAAEVARRSFGGEPSPEPER